MVAPVVAQNAPAAIPRLIESLGDPVRDETTLQELLDLREAVVEPLRKYFEDASLDSERGRARYAAALTLVRLLGDSAAPVKDTLVALVQTQGQGSAAVFRRGDEGMLLPATIHVIADLTPYGDKVEFHQLFHFCVVAANSAGDKDAYKQAVFEALSRFKARESRQEMTEARARKVLDEQELGLRELAAEALAAAKVEDAAQVLRDALLRREQKPKGWDAVTHNGIPVPMQDRFEFCAGRALVKLAPDEPVAVIGYAMLAVHHPLRMQRLAALRRLSAFGPDVADAVPELVRLASGDDAKVAAEALKALMVAGKAAGPHLATVEALTRSGDKLVARMATNLAATLRALGFEPAPVDAGPAAAAAKAAELRRLVDSIDGAEASAEVVAVLDADPDAALRALRERFAADRDKFSEAALAQIVRLALPRPEPERLQIAGMLAANGDIWSGPSFSSHSGGSAPTESRYLAYGTLLVGPTQDPVELEALLKHENATVRLEAAKRLAARPADVKAQTKEVRQGLLMALVIDHPKQSNFRFGNSSSGANLDLQDRIRAYAAAALRESSPDAYDCDDLLRCALQHPDTEVVVRCIEAYGPHADRRDLQKAADSAEAEAVRSAAKAVLDRLPPR
ncbi:MAG: hypothetical protein RL398_1041 [Planctomycetota bacterium]